MNLLFSILRAGHASGTHHKLALDALHNLGGAYCESWQRLILKHATLYFEGAKAPDNQFKDFKNHVLHVRDGLWGGATGKADNWYEHLLVALRDKNWSEAAWCAGVLSHYYTDPIHPFHTGQSVAENNVHRAVEWSISRSYDKLAANGAKALPKLEIELGEGDDWLKKLIIAGATKANGHYEALLTHYDFHRGVVDPPSGLDQTAQAFVGELIQYAVLSFSLVLQRAFKESAVVPPEVNLTADTVLATLKLPIKAILKRIDDKEMRLQVEAMYDELKATGRVEHAMPEDERILQALHAKEVTNRIDRGAFDGKEKLAASKAKPTGQSRPVVPQVRASGAIAPARSDSPVTPPAPPVSDLPVRIGPSLRPAASTPARPSAPVAPPVIPADEPAVTAAPVAVMPQPAATPAVTRAVEPTVVTAPLAAAAATAAASAMSGLGAMSLASRLRGITPRPVSERRDEHASQAIDDIVATNDIQLPSESRTASEPSLGADDGFKHSPDHVDALPIAAPRPAPKPVRPDAVSTAGMIESDDTRCHLTPEQDIVDAPSIGPKTAERLKVAGIQTVADLFAADPGALAEALDVGHIRAKTIAEWQDQARLVCEIPGLRGTHAQLLVGAGYRDLRRIARAEPREVSTDLLRYIQTPEGQRILRSGGAPDLEKIMSWVKAAERAWAAKAA